MSDKLKPCPFCGTTRHLYPSFHIKRVGPAIVPLEKPYAIDCVSCGFEFIPREGMDVIAMWNKRHDRRRKSAA